MATTPQVIEALKSGQITPDQFRALVNSPEGVENLTNAQITSVIGPDPLPTVSETITNNTPQQPQPTTLYGSDYSLQKMIGDETGVQPFNVDISSLIFRDPETNRSYVFRYGENEFSTNPPSGKSVADLELVRAIGKSRSNDDYYGVDIDPKKFTYGGRDTPERAAQLQAERDREPGYESGGGGLFYEYNDRTYYTPDNTGQSIPVGSTDITRDPVSKSGPVLSKGFTSYHDQKTDLGKEMFASDIAPPAKDLTFGNVFSINPAGSVIDTGIANPLSGIISGADPTITFSNPPSSQQNIAPFLNQAESFGQQNLMNSYNRDVLDVIMGGDGKVDRPITVGEIIQNTGGIGTSGSIDQMNQSGTTTGTGTDTGTDTDTGTGIMTSPQGQAFVPMSSGFFPSPERPTIPTGSRTFAPDPRLDPIFPQYGRTNVPPPSVGIPPGIPPFVRRPFLPTVRTDYDPAQLYRDSGLPAPGEPGYNPAITPNILPRQQGIASLPNPMLEEDSPSMTQGIMS